MADETAQAYEDVLRDPEWSSTRQLVITGTRFAHLRHEADVQPGVQHKLLVWTCEAQAPQSRCPCGLYGLAWQPIEEHADG